MYNKIKIMRQALRASSLPIELSGNVILAIHHKTGTVWLKSIFHSICRFYSIHYQNSIPEQLKEQTGVYFDNHSAFDFEKADFPFRGLHMIRDPRDVIISGCFYHQKSDEKWLHRPREEFGKLSYQEKINSIDSLDEKILFEMENCGSWTIHELSGWNYSREDFMEVKYEDLIRDTDLKLFHEIFSFLGFSGSAIPTLLSIAYSKTLFSGIKKKNTHIRSGKPKQWKEYFKPIHKERFIELFDDILIQLGYESDHEW